MKTFDKLPADLQRFAKRAFLKRAVPCVLLLLTFATVLFFFGDTLFSLKETLHKVVVYTLVMLLPFAITGVPHKLIDRTFYGTVEKIDLEMRNVSKTARPTYGSWYVKKTYVLTVRTLDGRLVKQRGQNSGAKIEHTADIYKIGDGVFHLYGSKHVVVFPESSEISLICPVCGGFNYSDARTCRDCGHTLIRDFPYSPKGKH